MRADRACRFLGTKAKAFPCSQDHMFGDLNLRLPYRRGRFHIHDHCIIRTDQVVVAIGKERPVTIGTCVARCRIGRGDGLGLHRCCITKCGIIQRIEIFLCCLQHLLWHRPIRQLHLGVTAGVGIDQ